MAADVIYRYTCRECGIMHGSCNYLSKSPIKGIKSFCARAYRDDIDPKFEVSVRIFKFNTRHRKLKLKANTHG